MVNLPGLNVDMTTFFSNNPLQIVVYDLLPSTAETTTTAAHLPANKRYFFYAELSPERVRRAAAAAKTPGLKRPKILGASLDFAPPTPLDSTTSFMLDTSATLSSEHVEHVRPEVYSMHPPGDEASTMEREDVSSKLIVKGQVGSKAPASDAGPKDSNSLVLVTAMFIVCSAVLVLGSNLYRQAPR